MSESSTTQTENRNNIGTQAENETKLHFPTIYLSSDITRYFMIYDLYDLYQIETYELFVQAVIFFFLLVWIFTL